MKKKHLIKNKLYALLLLAIGSLSLFISKEGTGFIFLLILAVGLFFSKEECMK